LTRHRTRKGGIHAQDAIPDSARSSGYAGNARACSFVSPGSRRGHGPTRLVASDQHGADRPVADDPADRYAGASTANRYTATAADGHTRAAASTDGDRHAGTTATTDGDEYARASAANEHAETPATDAYTQTADEYAHPTDQYAHPTDAHTHPTNEHACPADKHPSADSHINHSAANHPDPDHSDPDADAGPTAANLDDRALTDVPATDRYIDPELPAAICRRSDGPTDGGLGRERQDRQVRVWRDRSLHIPRQD